MTGKVSHQACWQRCSPSARSTACADRLGTGREWTRVRAAAVRWPASAAYSSRVSVPTAASTSASLMAQIALPTTSKEASFTLTVFVAYGGSVSASRRAETGSVLNMQATKFGTKP